MYTFSNLESRMLKKGAKEDLKLHILPSTPGFDATDGKPMLSGDSNQTVQQ